MDLWEKDPPKTPVIVAGSTGSRGTTMLLMKAVAKLPQGVLLLPGFDFDMPEEAWELFPLRLGPRIIRRQDFTSCSTKRA